MGVTLTMKWYNFLWEGLQTLLGCIVLLFLTGKKDGGLYKGRRIIWFEKGKFFSGTSLGYWILLPYDAGEVTTGHEYGHCMQSSDWGPLYLPVKGIPSLRNNLKARKCARTKESYYELYPEKDADRRGGVVWRDGRRVIM